MSDERLTALWRERGEAPLLESVPLDGGWLARTEGAVLLVREGRAQGATVDVRELSLAWRDRLLGAELVADGESLGVGARAVDAARRLLAIGRAAPKGTRPLRTAQTRYVEHVTDAEALALGALLDDDEVLLAWLESASETLVPSPVAEKRAPLVLLLTDRRQALVAVGPFGDVVVRELPAAAIEAAKSTVGRDALRAGEHEWQPPLLDPRAHELALLPALASEARVLEVARLLLASKGGGNGARASAEGLLAVLVERGDPYGVLTTWALSGFAVDEAVGRALALLREREASSAGLLKWWRAFRLPVDVGLALLAPLARDEVARAWAVELHAGLREASLAEAADPFEHAAIDLAYAEHLVVTARHEEAEVVLEARLAALPSEELLDLLPPDDADLTDGAGGQTFRIRALELLALARGGEGKRDAATMLALAQLQPLVPERVRALADVADGEVRDAAREVIAVLEPGGLAPLEESAPLSPDAEVFPLRKTLVVERVRHPATREGHALDKLQAFLASVDIPDHAALRAYCERLDVVHEAAWAALADASLALGVKGIGAFVSRGDRAIGIRAYESQPPFLVIGGRHLEHGDEHQLHPWELRFAVAAEVAHLRFGHSRVTASEVWAGALDKGRLGVDLVLGMVPVLKGVELVDRIGKIIDGFKKGPLGRVVKGLDLAERTVQKARGKTSTVKRERTRDELVAATNEKLIAAHRAMQLTADRAGLLLAADLGAALRAIFKSSPDYLSELPVALRHGVAKALSRRDDDGEILHQDLAVRVSSLIGFFLSDDYRVLRRALTARPGADP